MAGRRTIIAANWKMHKTSDEAVAFIEELEGSDKREVWLAVPFTLIHPVAEAAKGKSVTVGAQNMNDASEGAFTGEIAAKMLLDVGAQFVLIGHSERRTLFHESDEWIQKKMQRALADGLPPLLCVGENLEAREKGDMEAVILAQLLGALDGLTPELMKSVVIAYEPVWAIGTGRAATAEMAQEAHAFCRKVLEDEFGEATAKRTSILYGGSAKPSNAAELLGQPDIDGLLVGGASLDPDSFSQIVNA